ncbi:MAG: cell envelope biogenesis protein OmpA [Alphaproteobacteria bacterium]|nr:cell envelope biogenesis protein OmpA [Alphaproteobacteria bacterium]
MKNLAVAAMAALLLTACATDPFTGERKVSNTATGAGTGALLGTAAGALIGATTKAKTGTAMLVGAGVGAIAGGGIGAYMDNQEAKLREQLEGTGVSVTRDGDSIILNMPSNITFDTGRDEVKPAFYETLNSVAIVLGEFDQTRVAVEGHTDSDGSEAYNMELSERRASAVAHYLTAQALNPRRFSVEPFGESEPAASNTTAAGKSLNRRVEIHIEPYTG